MVNTNTKAIIEHNKNHIRRQCGGVQHFVAEIDSLKRPGYNGRRMSTVEAVRYYVEAGEVLIYSHDIINYLHRIGLTDDKKLDSYRGGVGGADGLYFALMTRDGVRLYEEYKKKHPTRR